MGESFDKQSLTLSEREVALANVFRYFREKERETGSSRRISMEDEEEEEEDFVSCCIISSSFARQVTCPSPISPRVLKVAPSLVTKIRTESPNTVMCLQIF